MDKLDTDQAKIITNSSGESESETSTPKGTVGEKTITDKNDFYDISATYPVDSWDKDGTMSNYVLDRVKKTQDEWKIGGQVYQSEQEVTAQFPDRAKITYQYLISYEKQTSTLKNTHSYILNTYQFTGGAHGISTIQTFTFNPNGPVDIQDILDLATDDNAVNLSKILLDKFKAQDSDAYVSGMAEEGLGLAYLRSDGTFDNQKCGCDGFNFASNFQKFYVTDNGLTFLFDQYQIAPGAAGILRVDLDWQTLKPYLKNNF